MRVYSTYRSFWRTHKLHIGVAGLVVLLHAGLIYALWLARADRLPATAPVFAEVIVNKPLTSAPMTTTKPATTARRASHKTTVPDEQPATQSPVIVTAPQLVAVSQPAETVSAALASETANEIAGPPRAASPSTVSSDLSLACPVRTAPVYPRSARRLGETGKVSLRVELDETGRVVSSDVAQTSGYARLDEAALAAVKSWRCQPAMRDGHALRIVSIESFEFTLDD